MQHDQQHVPASMGSATVPSPDTDTPSCTNQSTCREGRGAGQQGQSVSRWVIDGWLMVDFNRYMMRLRSIWDASGACHPAVQAWPCVAAAVQAWPSAPTRSGSAQHSPTAARACQHLPGAACPARPRRKSQTGPASRPDRLQGGGTQENQALGNRVRKARGSNLCGQTQASTPRLGPQLGGTLL